MLPIVFALIPTIVGTGQWEHCYAAQGDILTPVFTAMLIGLNNSGKKGVLLFGKSSFGSSKACKY